jgi:hypothetical protein
MTIKIQLLGSYPPPSEGKYMPAKKKKLTAGDSPSSDSASQPCKLNIRVKTRVLASIKAGTKKADI